MLWHKPLSLLLASVACQLPAGEAWIFPADEQSNFVSVPLQRKDDFVLLRRQGGGSCSTADLDPDTPVCVPLCAPSSDSCSSSPLERRSRAVVRDESPFRKLFGWNKTLELVEVPEVLKGSPISNLTRRAFEVITQDQLLTYLPNNALKDESPDATYGAPIELVQYVDGEDTDATVTVQMEFENSAFQIGSTGYLTGCTIVFVVSNRAVHAGHYWEFPSWALGTTSVFQQRVLNFFSGSGTQAGEGPALNPNLFNGTQAGEGPALNPNLFNAADDNTRVFIMVPRSDRLPNDPTSVQYRKVSQLTSAISGVLPKAQIVRWAYNRVDPGDVGGLALFQFDPNGFGADQLGWRVFLEQNVFRSDDPVYPSSAANGIATYNEQNAG